MPDYNPPSLESLKEKYQANTQTFSPNISMRMRRVLSWIRRASREHDDPDASFVFHWIAFNAAYSEDEPDKSSLRERKRLKKFFRKVMSVDRQNTVYNFVYRELSETVFALVDNRYVFQPFWNYQNKVTHFDDWQSRLEKEKRETETYFQEARTDDVLAVIFDRLYVLRNQLVHGGATWNGSLNRVQVRDGAMIMAYLVPVFVDLMMDNPDSFVARPYYPAVDLDTLDASHPAANHPALL